MKSSSVTPGDLGSLLRLGAGGVLLPLGMVSCSASPSALPAWCDDLPRPIYASLERLPAADPWFEVYRVRPGVLAIYEPHQFQEVISYLIAGDERAVLLDTGMGIGDISRVVASLTDLPVVVVNSHSHFDHVGGNADFEGVLALATDFTRDSARGVPNAVMREHVAPGALCRPLPAGVDPATYAIRPYAIARSLADGERLDLGGRVLEVIATPGHAPDAICLLDRRNGLLFTGDTFYEGPIFLFAPGTDLAAFRASAARLAALVPELELLLPGHNTPAVDPSSLLRLHGALDDLEESGGEVEEIRLDGFSLRLAPYE